jgi:tetratricopeptide (TPR) repeat protein
VSLAFLLPLIAQVGPGGALPQAPLQIPKPRSAAVAPPQSSDLLKDCLHLAMTRPSDAIEVAQNWLAQAKTMKDRAGAKQCHALALTRIEGWGEAAVLFLSAREDTPANEPDERARLGALAGNAQLAGGDPEAALAALELAKADSTAGSDTKQRGEIEVDRARALVAVGRLDEASTALTAARAADPKNHQAWLLSATLSRRQGKLAEAQTQIERAAELFPVDPEIGLEAGVIAVLSGREEAARKSWQSVIKAAPGSPAAKTAQGYLDQLGPPAAPSAK